MLRVEGEFSNTNNESFINPTVGKFFSAFKPSLVMKRRGSNWGFSVLLKDTLIYILYLQYTESIVGFDSDKYPDI